MGIIKLRPTRSAHIEDSRVIIDLDRMVSHPISFRLHGKIHQIEPMSTEVFFKVVNETSRLQTIALREDRPELKEMMEAYMRLFSVVCKSITRKDVDQMTTAQITALFKQIMECVTGHAYKEEAEKKKLSDTSVDSVKIKASLLVGELCRFYGWRDSDVLSMPAQRFFAMLESKRILSSQEIVHQCYISRCAVVGQEAFNEIVEFYQANGKDFERNRDEKKEESVGKEDSLVPTLNANSIEAKSAVMRAFAKDRRIHRKRTVVH